MWLTIVFSIAANMFKVRVTLQEGKLLLEGRLPVHITGHFALKVRFYKSDTMTEESIVFDPSLGDTDEINVKIVKEKLPKSFRDFTVSVAIVSNGQSGQFTLPSNKIGDELSFEQSFNVCVETLVVWCLFKTVFPWTD